MIIGEVGFPCETGDIWAVSHMCHQLAYKRCGEPLLTGVVFSNWSNWSLICLALVFSKSSSPSRLLRLVSSNSSPPTGPTGLRSVWRSALVFSKSSSPSCPLQVVLSKASTPTVSSNWSNWSNWSPICLAFSAGLLQVVFFSKASTPTGPTGLRFVWYWSSPTRLLQLGPQNE